MTTLTSLKQQWLSDSEVKKHYDDLSEEFQMAIALIKARDEAGYSQNDVADHFQMEPDFWINLQKNWELWQAIQVHKKIKPLERMAA